MAVRAVEAEADASTANAAVYFVVASNDADAHLIAFWPAMIELLSLHAKTKPKKQKFTKRSPLD